MEPVDFAADFQASKLRDARHAQRLELIVDALCVDPTLSFPKAMHGAALLGFYRFVGNERVVFDEVISGHLKETGGRAASVREVLVLHDTTDFECPSVSFRGHFSLAATIDRKPLGMTSVLLSSRGSHEQKAANAPNEQDRWLEGIEASALRAPNAVHVFDREGDDYKLLNALSKKGFRFVTRSRLDRLLMPSGRISEVLGSSTVMATREIRIQGRSRGLKSKADLRSHPVRHSRSARLAISAATLEIKKPNSRSQGLALNVVHVRELDCPVGENPVEWRLLTNEPVESTESVLHIVDLYRARWLIEEFFKSLKTGCEFEKRQHESYAALQISLAILTPLALQMLHLRTQAQSDEDQPAVNVLTNEQLQILAVLPRTAKMPLRTAREALLAVAALGGHIKNNGDPGWITIGRGFESLQKYEIGWRLAQEARSDLS